MTNIIAMIEVRSGQKKGISYGHLRQKTIVNRQWSIKKEATHTSSKLSGSSGQSSRYTLYDHNNNMYTNWFASFQAQRIFFFCIIIAFCHLEMLAFPMTTNWRPFAWTFFPENVCFSRHLLSVSPPSKKKLKLIPIHYHSYSCSLVVVSVIYFLTIQPFLRQLSEESTIKILF